MATTYLSRTSGTSTNVDKCTFSAWIKRGNLTASGHILMGQYTDVNNRGKITFTDDYLTYFQKTGGSTTANVVTTRKFKDVSAWYNVVIAFDSTQGTEADRIKFYVNGVQETAFSSTDYSQNENVRINESSVPIVIGQDGNSGFYFDGLMSYVAFVDGTQELPGIFGETDSTTGEWKIKTNITPSVAWGTNGFLILKNGNSLTDESTNSNNFTLGGGTLTDTEDCPDNNFATWNKSIGYTDALTNGNTTVTRSASGWRGAFSSLPLPTTGKFYCEFKISSGSNLSDLRAGIADDSFDGSIDLQNRNQVNQLGEQTNGISYTASNGNSSINASEASYGSAISTSNVLGMAVDMTNMKLYFSKDGVFQNSGDPTSGATGTGALAIPATLGKYFVAVGVNTSAWHVNFGNGTFGTIDITDAGTPGSTPGEFEYDVPTGYQPLTTKGLNA